MLLRVSWIMVLAYVVAANCKFIGKPASPQSLMMAGDGNLISSPRQLPFLTGVGKETSTPDFVRLVVMRFIYGLATTMGVEERLESLFNGAFVPPNADGDFFGFGGFGGLGGGDSEGDVGQIGDLADLAGLEGIFEDDGL